MPCGLVHILLADDEELFLKATADLLRAEGFACDCVQNAADAQAALAAQPYDVLIADINMRGNRDLEWLREHRPSVHGIPVIVVTGYPSVSTAVESLHLAVTDYLVKPLDFPGLLHSIARALEQRRIWQDLHHSRDDARAWLGALERLNQASIPPPVAGALTWPVHSYLAEAMTHIADVLTHAQRMMHTLPQRPLEHLTDVCGLLGCPRLAAYTAGLQEAVSVIEKTRHAFRSKDLAELRKKLQALLQEAPRSIEPSQESDDV
jgi:FixJ family two-component response regulator